MNIPQYYRRFHFQSYYLLECLMYHLPHFDIYLLLHSFMRFAVAIWIHIDFFVQVLYHEYLIGIHKSPVFDISAQVSTYSQATMGNQVISSDLYLMQMAAAHLRPDILITATLLKFRISKYLALTQISYKGSGKISSNSTISSESLQLEIFLAHILFIASIRTHFERNISDLIKQEVSTLLCINDRPHSGLLELLPEKFLKATSKTTNVRKIIKKLSIPLPATITAAGECRNGRRRPKNRVWKVYYDPLHVLLRAPHRCLYQSAEHRYKVILLPRVNLSINKIQLSYCVDTYIAVTYKALPIIKLTPEDARSKS